MARSNKYTSLNFNDIFDKQLSNTSSATANKPHFSPSSAAASKSFSASSYLSASRLTHGGMLVLSRPSPKPQQQPPPPPPAQSPPAATSEASDSISLRPQGKTGGGSNLSSYSSPSPSPAMEKVMSSLANSSLSPPQNDKFVPPHLRAGFVPKDVVATPPPPSAVRPGGFRSGYQYHYNGSPDNHRHGSHENHRPGSGHGYHNQYHGSPDNHRPGSGHGSYDNHRPGSGHGSYDNHRPGSGHGSYDNHRPGSGHGHQNQYHGSPNNRYMENGRVKPRGGYQYNNDGSMPDNLRPRLAHGSVQDNGQANFSGVGGCDLGYTSQPRSGGNRPNSSG